MMIIVDSDVLLLGYKVKNKLNSVRSLKTSLAVCKN